MIPRHHRFVKAVAHALRHRCGVHTKGGENVRIIVATSGGADSVALVCALKTLASSRGWAMELIVGHVQHHLREEAEGDAEFVAALADKLKLPMKRIDLDLSNKSGNVEAQARHARYEALAGIAQRCNARYVATAHHGDDQLETLLMRVLRGSSVRGLSGMAWRRRLLPGSDAQLIRPMLGVDREMALEFLRDLDQPWREDHTNKDVSRLRARLRRDVLPVLRDLRPDVSRRMVGLSEHLRDMAKLLDDNVNQSFEQSVVAAGSESHKTDGAVVIDRVEARRLGRSSAVLTGLLRRTLQREGVETDRLGGRALRPIIRAICDRHGTERLFQLNGGVKVVVSKEKVLVKRASS